MAILDIVGKDVRTVRVLDLGDFNEVYAGARFEVNVTPTRGHVREWMEITASIERMAETKMEDPAAALAAHNERVTRWLAETWGMPVEEVTQIRDVLQERNPLAWDWLYKRTFEVIGEYRKETLKN